MKEPKDLEDSIISSTANKIKKRAQTIRRKSIDKTLKNEGTVFSKLSK